MPSSIIPIGKDQYGEGIAVALSWDKPNHYFFTVIGRDNKVRRDATIFTADGLTSREVHERVDFIKAHFIQAAPAVKSAA